MEFVRADEESVLKKESILCAAYLVQCQRCWQDNSPYLLAMH